MTLPGCRSVSALLLVVGTAYAAPSPRLLTEPVAWKVTECAIDGVPASPNPFDPEQIRLDVVVTAPSGRERRVPAFWHQSYTTALQGDVEVLTRTGDPHWRVRFTAEETGSYRLVPLLSLTGGPDERGEAATVEVLPPRTGAPRGWSRVDDDRRSFATTDGTPLRLVGANVCWPEKRGTYDFVDWFDAMAKGGQNYARLWLAPWWAGIEHKPGRLNRYALDEAWRLDEVFRLAEARGIHLMLCFDHHGMFQADDKNWGGTNNFWPTNPYALENGGPCAAPNDFFTHPQAAAIYEKRLRYLVARYGASPWLHSWQLFNEIDNVFRVLRADDVVAWHRRMAGHLRTIDPWNHLISTSLTGGSERPAFWEMPEMDFSVYHSYGDASPATLLADLSRGFAARYRKPFLVGEFGTSAANWNRAADPHLRGYRQALWGSVLGGSTGTALTWWWQDIHASGAWEPIGAVAAVMRSAGWEQRGWTPIAFPTPPPRPSRLSGPAENAKPFTASVLMQRNRDRKADGRLALNDALAAQRAADQLSAYLHGSRRPELRTAHRIETCLAAGAALSIKVRSVAGSARLAVRCDGAVLLDEALGMPAEQASRTQVLGKEFRMPLPAGHKTIEIANEGIDFILLEHLRLENVLPACLPGDWRPQPEIIGLQRGDAAVVYLNSPHAPYPANALERSLPMQMAYSFEIPGIAPGEYLLRWHRPKNGALLSEERRTAVGGKLALTVPDYDEDIAVVIARTAPAEH